MKLALVIVAAGSGTRMKLNINKIFNTFECCADEWVDERKSAHFLKSVESKPIKSNSKMILELTLSRFIGFNKNSSYPISEIIITYRKQDYEEMCHLVKKLDFDTKEMQTDIRLIEGGSERYLSVHNALKSLSDDITHVLVHDGVRPFLSIDLFERLIDKFSIGRVVIPTLKLTDTIRELENNTLGRTLNRERMCSVQTPQCYSIEIARGLCSYIDEFLSRNTKNSDLNGITDDSSLIARVFPDERQVSVEGSKYNIKITTSEDMDFANMIYNYLGE